MQLMKVGKISETVLKSCVLTQIKSKNDAVENGAGVGSDCAVFACGDTFTAVCTQMIEVKSSEDVGCVMARAAGGVACCGAKPVMATIGMFAAFGYWNDWFQASLYLDDKKLQTLQSLLNNVQKGIEYLANNPYGGLSMQQYKASMPTESVRMAIAIVIIVPIALTYPFFQKYFISGLTIGSVKE